MANGRVASISIGQLAGAVNRAVKQVEEKHKVSFEGESIQFVPNWQILGRILREAELAQAEKVATELTQSINEAVGSAGVEEFRSSSGAGAGRGAGQFQPAVVWNGHHIICGARPAPEVILSE